MNLSLVSKLLSRAALPAVLVCGLLMTGTDAHAASSKLKKVCKTTFRLSNGQGLIKSEISNHISPADPRSTGYTLVCGSVCASSFPATIYYSDGKEAAKLGYYGTFGGNGKPRAYCAAGGTARCYVSLISAAAKRKSTGSKLYLKINSTQCIEFDGSPGARNGSV